MSRSDPSWAATRDDLRRLAWVLALVWLALAAFTALAQRYLGWRLAAGLIGGAGALFTLGIYSSPPAASRHRRLRARLPLATEHPMLGVLGKHAPASRDSCASAPLPSPPRSSL